jgi:hypothetical protein
MVVCIKSQPGLRASPRFGSGLISEKTKGVNLCSSRLFKFQFRTGSKTPLENKLLPSRIKTAA